MAIVPGESIKEFTSLKPSTVVVWCLLCEVKQGETVYLELEKAEKYGVKKSAFYHAFNELVGRGWLELAGNFDGRKWWRPVKGFRRDSANAENLSANVESFSANAESRKETPAQNSANVENFSANVEKPPEKELDNSANVENSINAEKIGKENSANVESPFPYIKPPLKPQETIVSFGGGGEARAPKPPPPPPPPERERKKSAPKKFRLPADYPLSDEMIDWAKRELPGIKLIEAHENFVEHWSNRTDDKAERFDWDLTWRKGMRLAYQWQLEDEEKAKRKEEKNAAIKNAEAERAGRRTNYEIGRDRDYSAFEGLDPAKAFKA
ncbi:MAG: hypothetical protein JSS81_07305 [Acidobacteria bacterium]|nr:hypothetical protein [Acidobacteriota bacterium]